MHIRRGHALGADEVRRRVDRLATDIGRRFDLRSEWRGGDLEFSGSGVSGRIAVSDDAVDVDVRLGIALRLMEGTIRQAIENAMDRHLD